MKEVIKKLAAAEDLGSDEVRQVVHGVAEGKGSDAQLGAFLMGLATKGPTPEELAALVSSLRELCCPSLGPLPSCLDIRGMGSCSGDIAIAVTTAATGVPVAKGLRPCCCRDLHGFEILGLRGDLPPRQALQLLEQIGLTFVPVPVFHLVVSAIISLGRQLSPLFGVVEALINPLGPRHYLLGVSEEDLLGKVTETLVLLGYEGALVNDSASKGEARLWEVRGKKIREHLTTGLGLDGAKDDPFEGHNPVDLLCGEVNGRLLFYTAGGLLAAGEVEGIEEGLEKAYRTVRSGAPETLLQRVQHYQSMEQHFGFWTRDAAKA